MSSRDGLGCWIESTGRFEVDMEFAARVEVDSVNGANVVERHDSNFMTLKKLETLSSKSANIVDDIRCKRNYPKMVHDLGVYREEVRHYCHRQTYIVDCDVAVTESNYWYV